MKKVVTGKAVTGKKVHLELALTRAKKVKFDRVKSQVQVLKQYACRKRNILDLTNFIEFHFEILPSYYNDVLHTRSAIHSTQ